MHKFGNSPFELFLFLRGLSAGDKIRAVGQALNPRRSRETFLDGNLPAGINIPGKVGDPEATLT